MKNSYRRPHSFKKKKSILRSGFLWFSFLIIVVFFSLFYFFVFSDVFQIRIISVSGQEKIAREDAEELASLSISKKIAFWETKSILLLDETGLRESFLENFPQMEEIGITRRFPDGLELSVKERTGLVIWCQKDCFFADKEGIVFEVVPEDEASLPKIRDLFLQGEVSLGQNVMPGEELARLADLWLELETEVKLSLASFDLIGPDRVNVRVGEGWQIYFNPQNNLEWQVTKLRAVLEEKIPQDRRGDLEYVELRFGNLAPYKYKD